MKNKLIDAEICPTILGKHIDIKCLVCRPSNRNDQKIVLFSKDTQMLDTKGSVLPRFVVMQQSVYIILAYEEP